MDFLNGYTTKILCLSVFIGLIQMILPKGKLKQNVLFTSMIVITIVVIEPLVNFLNKDIDISKIYAQNKDEYNLVSMEMDYDKYYSEKVKITYEENLRNDMVRRLEEAGYKINSIKCEVDEETLEPKSLRLEIETEDGVVQPVRIEVSNNSISNKKEVALVDKLKIQKIAYDNYGIKEVDISWKNY